MAGNGLRRGSGESAEFPTGVKEVLTLLVNSKTPQKAILHLILEGQGDRVYCVEQRTPMLLEIQQPRLNQQSRSWPCLPLGSGILSLAPAGDPSPTVTNPWKVIFATVFACRDR
jgi:hypothetical protein